MPDDDPKSPRDQILHAAMRLFLSKGYSATSMRDIAAEAGQRAVAGIYNHFASKEAIFTALVNEITPFELVFGEIENIEAETAPDYIRQILSRVMPVVIHHADYLELIQIDMREFQGVHTRALITDRVIPRALNIFARIQTLPGLKVDNPLVLLRVMVSLVAGFMFTYRINVSYLHLIPDEQWIQQYIDVYLYGVAASPPLGRSND